jgi:hypothetical protein
MSGHLLFGSSTGKGFTPTWPFFKREKTGSISLGCSFVAGNKRVPKPAAGTTTFLIKRPHKLHVISKKQYIIIV